MRGTISNTLIARLKPAEKPYEVRDDRLPGFILRVQPSGAMSYVAQYARGKRITVGSVSVLTPAQARDEARLKLADAVRGADPMAARKASRSHTLESFVDEKYGTWVTSHHSDPKETLRKIKSFYATLGNKKLGEINSWLIEKHRSGRLKKVKPSTANRDLDELRAAMSKAVAWGFLESNPVSPIKRLRVDTAGRVRYLEPAEEKRLRAALDTRQERMREARLKFNVWRAERGYKLLPQYGTFTDHLKPIVLVALNTGMRRGELFKLSWSNIDLERRMVTVAGTTAKSRKTRHIPLNDEVYEVLKAWAEQTGQNGLVFPGRDGRRLRGIKTSWGHLMKSAKITNFHFHDCRHDFASKLVMAGEDLNTVRELLGHADIKMTLRYAHLAPRKFVAAVARLGQGR